jgi:hypothetical protein
MPRILRSLAVSAAVLTAAVAVVRAQAMPELPSRPIPGWSFTPAVTIGVLHDSNATLRATVGRSEGLSDQLWTVQPAGAVKFLGKYTTFDASYRGELHHYASLDALDQYTQRGSVSVSHRATPHVSFSARNTYTRVPTTDELDIPGIVPFSRTGTQVDTLTAGTDVALSPFTTMSAVYTGSWIRFDEPDNLVLRNADLHGVSGTLSRRMSQRISLGGSVEYRFANLDEGRHQFRFLDAGGTLVYHVSEHTALDGEVGVAHVTDQANLTAKTGPMFRVGVTQRTEHALLGLTYQHLFVPSIGFAGANSSQQVRGFAHVPLGRRLFGDQSLSWRRSDPLLANELRLQSLLATSAVGYEWARWFTVRGFYQFSRQDSEVFGGKTLRHRIGVEATFSQPMRIQ